MLLQKVIDNVVEGKKYTQIHAHTHSKLSLKFYKKFNFIAEKVEKYYPKRILKKCDGCWFLTKSVQLLLQVLKTLLCVQKRLSVQFQCYTDSFFWITRSDKLKHVSNITVHTTCRDSTQRCSQWVLDATNGWSMYVAERDDGHRRSQHKFDLIV